jgi:hypothetical protein
MMKSTHINLIHAIRDGILDIDDDARDISFHARKKIDPNGTVLTEACSEIWHHG